MPSGLRMLQRGWMGSFLKNEREVPTSAAFSSRHLANQSLPLFLTPVLQTRGGFWGSRELTGIPLDSKWGQIFWHEPRGQRCKNNVNLSFSVLHLRGETVEEAASLVVHVLRLWRLWAAARRRIWLVSLWSHWRNITHPTQGTSGPKTAEQQRYHNRHLSLLFRRN